MIHTSMFQKHIHKVKFYPSADDFTQALLVMLVTNIMSVLHFSQVKEKGSQSLPHISVHHSFDSLPKLS